jgi:hypothetical protein
MFFLFLASQNQLNVAKQKGREKVLLFPGLIYSCNKEISQLIPLQ